MSRGQEVKGQVLLGKLGAAVGLRGEQRVILYAGESENLREGITLIVRKSEKDEAHEILSLRYQKGIPVVRLSEVGDRTAAENLTGFEVAMLEEELLPLEEGGYYYRDLIGAEVTDTDGVHLGTVTDVLTQTSQALWVVLRENGKELLIPDVPAFVKSVDAEEGRLEVELLEGMADL